MIKYALIYVVGVFVSSVSQVILKKASAKTYDNPIREYLNFPVIAAYTIFFAATLLSIYAFKGISLSMGAVLDATGYLFVTLFGVTIFNEKINGKKALALLLIIGGICVYSLLG